MVETTPGQAPAFHDALSLVNEPREATRPPTASILAADSVSW
jgi:hypothetical protein